MTFLQIFRQVIKLRIFLKKSLNEKRVDNFYATYFYRDYDSIKSITAFLPLFLSCGERFNVFVRENFYVVFVKPDEDEKALVIGKIFSMFRRKSAVSGST